MEDVEHWSPACVQKHILNCVIHTRNWHPLHVWLWPIGFHRDKRILCVHIGSPWDEQVAGRPAAQWHSQSLLIKSGSAVSGVGELPSVAQTGNVKPPQQTKAWESGSKSMKTCWFVMKAIISCDNSNNKLMVWASFQRRILLEVISSTLQMCTDVTEQIYLCCKYIWIFLFLTS